MLVVVPPSKLCIAYHRPSALPAQDLPQHGLIIPLGSFEGLAKTAPPLAFDVQRPENCRRW